MYILHNLFLPPATKLGQGNLFRSVCQEFCSRGSGWVSRPTPRGGAGWGVWMGGEVSRPTPRGELGSLARGGSPGPHPGARLGGLARGSPAPHLGRLGGVWWGVSRPTPGGGCRLGCLAGGSPGPHSGGRLGGLAGGLQAHTWGGGVGQVGDLSSGSPGPHPGDSRPTPRVSPGPHLGLYLSMHWGRHPPPPKQTATAAVGTYHSCYAFLLYFTNSA